MKRMVLAAVVAAAVAVAALPILAQSQNPGNPASRAAVAPLGASESGAGPMQGGPMMRRMGMMRHMRMMRGTPQQRCAERLARRAGMRAYVGAMLDLTAQQRPLWEKVESAARSEEEKERQLCAGLKAGAATLPDRLAHMQQYLSLRLAAVKSAKPAVDALYNTLTPQQRMVIDHPFRRP